MILTLDARSEPAHNAMMDMLFPGSPRMTDWLTGLGFETNCVMEVIYNTDNRLLRVIELVRDEDKKVRTVGIEAENASPITTVRRLESVDISAELLVAWEAIAPSSSGKA